MPYIGTPGAMVKIPGSTSLNLSYNDRTTTYTTVGGKRVAQRTKRIHSSWDVTVFEGGAGGAAGVVGAFAAGEFGPGPFTYIPEWAYHGNMLSLEKSTMQVIPRNGATIGGPFTTAGVSVGSSLLVQPNSIVYLSWSKEFEWTPVFPGEPVTASAYVSMPGARVELWFYDMAKTNTRKVVGSGAGAGGGRVSVTAQTQPGEVYALLVTQSTASPFKVARPAITITDTVQTWEPGALIPKCIITGFQLNPVHIDKQGNRRLADVSFTIQEVG